ncbi:hypothetical protein K1719_020979 [Acacia pycnantha]|nr:hypothetical protein K1719_020979 [Acacia pycnantha]
MRRKSKRQSYCMGTNYRNSFIVDGYSMVESDRLDYIRKHQKELRVDLYSGITDALTRGETDPSSTVATSYSTIFFHSGARYMIQNYQDAMAICAWAGYPDIFITFTCNPMWPEITRHCDQDGLKPCDRPEILSRIFNLKLHKLMRTLKDQKIFGSIKADVYTIEFQKRGLPHAHIILWLSESDKIRSSFEVGVPVMLIRNIDQAAGMCNRTRLQISQLGKNVIKAKALNVTSIGEEILIHRMDMNPSETKLPFNMTRRQFPIIISFAMTINKSQGQSMTNVECSNTTLNVVYREVFQNLVLQS